MLSHFSCILWFLLAFVGQELGPYWAYLGPFWAMLGHFGQRWHHIGLMLGHFALFSDLCRPLFWTWAFRPCKAFAQNTQNTRKKYNLWTALLMVFAAIFLFLFLSWGMLQLGYVCLISGLCWAIVGYVGTILGSCWAILLYSVVCVCLCWAILGVFCGLCWPLLGKSWDQIRLILGHFGLCWDILGNVGTVLSYVGPYWAYLGPFWAMLGHFGQRWHHIGLMLGHFALFSDLCRPLPWTWAFQCRWIFVHARRLQKTPKIPGENTICGVRCWLFLLFFLFLSWGMLQLGYVCLISGLCWAIVGYVGTILGSCWAILWFVLAFVGQELGPYSA